MPIYRLSAQELRGIVIDNDRRRAMEIVSRGHEAFAMLIRRAMVEYGIRPIVCGPGIVNITPTYWRRNRTEHILEVLPDGEHALYHAVPKAHGLAPAPYDPVGGEVVAQDLRGTKSIRLPEDVAVVPLVGAVREDPRIRVHELIMHMALSGP